MVPGPRSADELGDPAHPDGAPGAEGSGHPVAEPHVALTRTARGWVVFPLAAGVVAGDPVDGLVEGMTLADLVAGELGCLSEPDRTTRRAARGPVQAATGTDPVEGRVAALQRTVAQLEHALAARVSTERAIGVLAERHGCSPRAAFEMLRHTARTQGRPVVELAREVLDGLAEDAAAPPIPSEVAFPVAGEAASAPRAVPVGSGAGPAGDGRS